MLRVYQNVSAAVFAGLADTWSHVERALTSGEARSVEWLCSGNLLTTVLATMTDLVNVLHKARQGGESSLRVYIYVRGSG